MRAVDDEISCADYSIYLFEYWTAGTCHQWVSVHLMTRTATYSQAESYLYILRHMKSSAAVNIILYNIHSLSHSQDRFVIFSNGSLVTPQLISEKIANFWIFPLSECICWILGTTSYRKMIWSLKTSVLLMDQQSVPGWGPSRSVNLNI
jgi:hypothetical protein